MKTEKIIHRVYKEFEEASKKEGIKIPQIIGKYQYIFSNSKGKISLINEIRTHNNMPSFWEIYCLKGKLFSDTERFSTKDKAIKKVKEYLGVDELSELVSKKLEKIHKELLIKRERKLAYSREYAKKYVKKNLYNKCKCGNKKQKQSKRCRKCHSSHKHRGRRVK